MNLTQNDLRLFELLDWEIDKTLSFGCIVKQDWENAAYYNFVYKSNSFVYLRCINPVTKNISEYQCWREDFKKMQTLWHYPTHWDVLRYVQSSVCEINPEEPMSICWYNNLYLWLKQTKKIIRNDDYSISTISYKKSDAYKLDLTKPIQNYSEEVKAELIKFLESIK